MTNTPKPEAGARGATSSRPPASRPRRLATSLFPSGVHAAGSDAIKVGLVGCGGRGTGASDNVLHSALNVQIVALADVFQDRQDGCRDYLTTHSAQEDKVQELGNKVDLPKERRFVGLDAYQKLIDCPEVNYIILATPPGFRPYHLRAAVDSGKTIFTEKPVGTDCAGHPRGAGSGQRSPRRRASTSSPAPNGAISSATSSR